MRLLRLPFLAVALCFSLNGACRDGGETGAGGGIGAGTGGAGGASSSTSSTHPEGKPIRIMDWNTHNYFDTTDDPATSDIVLGMYDYKNKRKTIGAAIAAQAADIVMLAEIEDQGVLDDLNKTELGGAYGTAIVSKGNDERGINVAMLSKIAPDSVVTHADEFFTKAGTNGPSYKYSRDCLEVHLTFNGRKIILLGVHFKAKNPPDDPDKRLAEAQHTRAIADALAAKDPSAGIIILGDYNDTPGSPPVGAVTGKAPSLFVDAADSVAAAQRYSFKFNGQNELIDHQIMNPVLAPMLDAASAAIVHGQGVDDATPYSSDHAPVIATYKVY